MILLTYLYISRYHSYSDTYFFSFTSNTDRLKGYKSGTKLFIYYKQ